MTFEELKDEVFMVYRTVSNIHAANTIADYLIFRYIKGAKNENFERGLVDTQHDPELRS